MTQPAAGRTCQFGGSPVAMAPVERALIPALENWVVKNIAPPASRHPTVAAGTAGLPTAAAMGFPDLSAVTAPNGASAAPLAMKVGLSRVNQLFVTDHGTATPVADLSKGYTLLVP